MMHYRTFLAAMLVSSQTLWAQEGDKTPSLAGENAYFVAHRFRMPQARSHFEREDLTWMYRPNALSTLNERVPGLMAPERSVMGYGTGVTTSNLFSIRGIGGADRTRLFVDGMPTYTGVYGQNAANAMMAMMADGAEVVRGPEGSFVGNGGMAGSINLLSRQRTESGEETTAEINTGSYGTMQVTAHSSVKVANFFASAGALLGRTDGHRSDTRFMQEGGFAKAGVNVGKHWQLQGLALLSYCEDSNPGSLRQIWENKDIKGRTGLAHVSLYNSYDRSHGAARVYFNFGRDGVSRGWRLGATLQQTFPLGPATTLSLAADYSGWDNSIRYSSIPQDSLRRKEHELGFRAQARHQLLNCLSLYGAIRFDSHSRMGSEWSPCMGAELALPFKLRLTGNISKGHRNPTLAEQFVYNAENRSLQAERLTNYEVAVRQSLLGGRMRWAVTAFYLRASRLMEMTRVNDRWQAWNTGQAEHGGLEAEVNVMPFDWLGVHANYSVMGTSRARLLAPKHKFFMEGDVLFWRFQLSAGLQYLGGLHTMAGNTEATEYATLVNLAFTYHTLSVFHVFLRADNLLGQRYSLANGISMPKATVMIGAGVNL